MSLLHWIEIRDQTNLCPNYCFDHYDPFWGSMPKHEKNIEVAYTINYTLFVLSCHGSDATTR